MKTSDIQSIILADDDRDDCDLFLEALHEVADTVDLTLAKNGLQLLELLNKPDLTLPDLIFLDMNMPYMNGLESLNEIKKNKNLREINIVMFSTSAQDIFVNQAYAMGANVYICKPSSFDKLKRAIEYTLSFGRDMPRLPREAFVRTF